MRSVVGPKADRALGRAPGVTPKSRNFAVDLLQGGVAAEEPAFDLVEALGQDIAHVILVAKLHERPHHKTLISTA